MLNHFQAKSVICIPVYDLFIINGCQRESLSSFACNGEDCAKKCGSILIRLMIPINADICECAPFNKDKAYEVFLLVEDAERPLAVAMSPCLLEMGVF